MDFFEFMNDKEEIFEKEETISELSLIATEVKKYDVYDVLAKISGLNLLSHNQNKSILLDALITAIVNKPEVNWIVCEGSDDKLYLDCIYQTVSGGI